MTFDFNLIMVISVENTMSAYGTHGFGIFNMIGIFNLIMEGLAEIKAANNTNAQEIADDDTSTVMAIFVENAMK